jgi:hypothetical protein
MVKDTALRLLKTYMRDYRSDSNWDDFKQILINSFQSIDLHYRNRVKITNFKQGSDSIETYNKIFLGSSTQLLMICYFIIQMASREKKNMK